MCLRSPFAREGTFQFEKSQCRCIIISSFCIIILNIFKIWIKFIRLNNFRNWDYRFENHMKTLWTLNIFISTGALNKNHEGLLKSIRTRPPTGFKEKGRRFGKLCTTTPNNFSKYDICESCLENLNNKNFFIEMNHECMDPQCENKMPADRTSVEHVEFLKAKNITLPTNAIFCLGCISLRNEYKIDDLCKTYLDHKFRKGL